MAKINVKKVAELASLPLTQNEEHLYQDQLEEILSYVDQIEKKINAVNVDPLFNTSSSVNVQGEDLEIASLTQEESLQNAKNKSDGYFVTKGVFTEE